MSEDNNSIDETIETPKKKRAPRKKVEILTKCRVLKGHCIKEGEFIPLYIKNSDGQYLTRKIETAKGAIRHERRPNIIELNLEDLKASLKLKAVEVVD